MWGLTFTLYPDGNFNIEFDCKQPKGHEAALTQADALSFMGGHAGLGQKCRPTPVKIDRLDDSGGR
jgi:hypothetical protein